MSEESVSKAQKRREEWLKEEKAKKDKAAEEESEVKHVNIDAPVISAGIKPNG